MTPEERGDRVGQVSDAIHDLASVVLLARMQRGETAARDELLRRYWPRLARWARGRLPSGARDLYDTTDLVQETVVRALHRLDEFQPEHDGALLAYLRTAISNRIRTLAKRAGQRGERLAPDTAIQDRAPSPLEGLIGRDALGCYERALQRLTPQDRLAVQVRIELDLPYDEITRELGKSTVTAARMAVSRALFRLATEMQREARI